MSAAVVSRVMAVSAAVVALVDGTDVDTKTGMVGEQPGSSGAANDSLPLAVVNAVSLIKRAKWPRSVS